MLNAFDYLKAALSAVNEVVRDTIEEQKKKAATSPVFTAQYEVSPPVREHTYDPFPYEEYVDPVRNYVSPEEYSELPQDKREEVALHHYTYAEKHRNKSNEEIGRDYERFIAYQYTRMGYHVNPRGILRGKGDGGIDLIAQKRNETLLIQCKYWGRGKVIYENVVEQLEGSCRVYRLKHQHEGEQISPMLITNITLDPVARQTAELLHISYREKCFLTDYPLVKCCTFYGERGQDVKLYFLPFDEVYDYVNIESKDVSYAFSVAEAVYRGFRRDCDGRT